MEVIEINSSDDEEEAVKKSNSSEVIVISSPSDREDSPSVPADGKLTIRISTARLDHLRKITKKKLGNRFRTTGSSSPMYSSKSAPVRVNGHLTACDSPISVESDGECGLPSMFCHGESKTEHANINNQEREVTPVKAHVKLTEVRQPTDHRQFPQKDTEFRQSPLQDLLEETSNKAVHKKSPTQRSLCFYKNIHKSPLKPLLPSPKLQQTTLSPDSFSPKRLCLSQPSRGQASSVPVVPPQHIVPAGLASSSGGAQFFTEAQIIILESLLEEEILQTSFLNTVTSFTSQSRKPTPELVRKMLQKILLHSRKAAISFSCSRTLKVIQALHPDVTACAVEELKWDFVQEIIEQLEDFDSDNMVATNAILALSFVVNVLEVDLKRKQSSKKSKAFRMLSTSCPQNVEKVVEWIRDVVPLCTGTALHHDVVPVSQCCCHDVLSLLQRLLCLSLDVCDMPIGSARRITNGPLIWAYMHPSLSNVKCKTLLLESLQSHLLRSTFIELIFQNYCQELANPYHCGLQGIVSNYFLYVPPSYTVDSSAACRSQSECEEFVMLLAFLMQSYIFCNTGCFKTNPETELSLEVVETLRHLEEHVQRLQERLEALCNPLSEKTYAFLKLMIYSKNKFFC